MPKRLKTFYGARMERDLSKSSVIEVLPAKIDRPDLRRFAQILDRAVVIPGTDISLGLDSVIGLIPGFGDALGTLLSAYIVLEAAKEGVSNFVLVRMIGNVAADSILGSIPILGDIFDLTWRANLRNIELLERSPAVVPAGPHNRRRLFYVGVAMAAFAIALLLGGLALLVRMLG